MEILKIHLIKKPDARFLKVLQMPAPEVSETSRSVLSPPANTTIFILFILLYHCLIGNTHLVQ